MEQEKIENISQIDREPRQQLVETLMVLRRLRDKSESTMDSKGSLDAERTILVNIPVIANLTNGDLKGTGSGRALSDASHLQKGVSCLSEVEVVDTQAGLTRLLSLVKAVGSVSVGRRLDAYLPVTIPDTADGFKSLLYMARNVEITEQSGVPESFAATLKTLRQLDQQVCAAGREDPGTQEKLLDQAQKVAVKRFERLKEAGSSQLLEVATVLAEQKLAALRREHIEVEGAGRTYSRFEILANQIIDQEGLKEQNGSVEANQETRIEKAREVVLSVLVRKRGTERLLAMIESDELFCRAIAKKQRMTSEELLTAESSVKRHALNGVLFSKQIILSEADRRVFNGQKVLNEERERLLLGMAKDPLVFITGLSDEEIQAIRTGMPKTSSSRSIFDLAKERLKAKLIDSATDEELIGVMSQAVVGEFLTARSSVAVDLVLRDLGVDPKSVLTNSENLTELVQSVIDKSLPYLRIDSTAELNQLKLERKGQRPRNQAKKQTVFRLLLDELSQPNPNQPLIVGRSEVTAMEVSSKGAQKAIGVLDRLADLGLLQDRSRKVISAIVHKANTAIFVGLPLSEQRQRFIHTRVLTEDAKGKYGWGDAQNIKEITRCRALTGLCLFSSSAVTAVGESGVKYALTNPYVNGEIDQPVIRIDVDQRIQPYEADSVLRLSEIIRRLNPERVSSVVLAVPRIEYWLYAMDAYEKGLIDSNLMLEWFNQVDKRAGRIVDLITRKVAKSGLKITQVDPLRPVALSLVQDVQNDRRGLLPKLVEQLVDKSNLVGQTEIASYSDLSYLSYILGYLNQLDSETEMLVVVENPEEMGILNRTRGLIGQVVSGKTIIGLYPHTNLVMSQDPETIGGRSLYFFDPKSRLRTALKEVVGANKI